MVASAVLPYGWGYAFILPAAIMAAMAIIIALYLVVEPEDIGYGSPYEDSVRLLLFIIISLRTFATEDLGTS